MTISYPVGNNLYINLTNRCPCACTFCLRQNGPGVYGSDPLWLDHEPTYEEIITDLARRQLADFGEIVFCGYGEPTERLDVLLQTARYLKAHNAPPIRINTNGLADLIWNRPTAPDLAGLIDTVSISLNARDPETYLKLTRSRFGLPSFDAMLRFTRECTRYVPHVVMTVVDQVTTPEEQEACRQLCTSLGATLRVRPFES